MAQELRYVVGVKSSLTQPRAIRGPQIVPDQTFDLRIETSPDKRTLDVSVWPTRYGTRPYKVIRPLALAECEKYLPNLRVYLDAARPAAFGVIEYNQVAEEIALPHLKTQLLTLARSRSNCEWNHRGQVLSQACALSQQSRFLVR